MADLIAELEGVVRGIEEAPEHTDAAFIALRFIDTHHAEIAAAVRDATRWRAVRYAPNYLGVYEGLAGRDSGLELLTDDKADEAADKAIAAMRAGEGEG